MSGRPRHPAGDHRHSAGWTYNPLSGTAACQGVVSDSVQSHRSDNAAVPNYHSDVRFLGMPAIGPMTGMKARRGFCDCYLVAMAEGALFCEFDNWLQSVVKRISTTNGHYQFSI